MRERELVQNQFMRQKKGFFSFFFFQDVILIAIGAAGYLAGAASLANYANSWREIQNVSGDLANTVARVTNATAAAAVSMYVLVYEF